MLCCQKGGGREGRICCCFVFVSERERIGNKHACMMDDEFELQTLQ